MQKNLGLLVSAIEWYDNALAIAFASVISHLFFPSSDKVAQFLLYFSSITIGYFGRPLGAFLFGYYSDKYSRTKATYHSLMLMNVASLFISFLPSYISIGIAAPVIFAVTVTGYVAKFCVVVL